MNERKVSGIILMMLLFGLATLAFDIRLARASETIYIRADGSIDPPIAPIQRVGDLYTFTNNIYDSIVIEKNNIVVNGAGYTLQGTGSGTGLDLSGRSNVTIKNIRIEAFDLGIDLDYSSNNNSISGNTITENNWAGILIYFSSNNSISGNNITENNYEGIYVSSSLNNSISGNNITNNWEYGIWLGYSSNNSISGNNITENNDYGIWLWSSSNNSISGNNITNNVYGIWLDSSSNYNSISENNITENNDYGIRLRSSSNYNSISENNITNNVYGIMLYPSSSNNSISGNTITENNWAGIWLGSSSNYNSISENNITENNAYGIYLYSSSNNSIYHDNFVNNTQQAYSDGSINVWDDGYPSGGNFWSDYTGLDLYSGPYQNETGSDGMGDTPYIIDANNQDRYPCMHACMPNTYTLTISATAGGITNPVPGTYSYIGGTAVSVSAIPDVNHMLDHWELDGDNVGPPNPISVTMDKNHALRAVFKAFGFPIGTFVIPMDEKQNLLTTENATVYGFIWSILDAGADIYRVIEPSDITLKTTTYLGGAIYSGGVILVMPTYAGIIEEKRLNFPDIIIDTLTELLSISPDQLFFVENPQKILVIYGFWGETEVTLDWMKIPYTLVTRYVVENNATIIHDFDLVVVDCPGWMGGMPNYVVSNFTFFANHGGEVVFTDIALLDLANVFPGYVNVVPNFSWVGNVSIHNPPLTGFSAEFPSQYPTTFPNTTKIYTMGAGKIVDTILNITEVRVLMDTSEYGGANRTLAFYFPYGNGLVEGFAYHPQEQIESITGDPYSYVVSSMFYGNKFIHAIPTDDVAITKIMPYKTVVGQGYSLNINVTAENQGKHTETFNVSVYANETLIETKEVTLSSGNSSTITFSWNTTGFAKGNYTISAYAWSVQGETHTADNYCTGGLVIVTMLGDFDGDRDVDSADRIYMARAYRTYWQTGEIIDSRCDFDEDGDIDSADRITLARAYRDYWYP